MLSKIRLKMWSIIDDHILVFFSFINSFFSISVNIKRRLGETEIWSKPDQVKGDIFYLYFNAAAGEVELTKVMSD